MKVLCITPVYPPETSPSAAYSRRFAQTAAQEHAVTVATYASHYLADESFVVNAVKKSMPTVVRFMALFIRLFISIPKHDVVIVHEVVAAGLPAVLAAAFRGKKVIVHMPFDEITQREHVSGLQKRIARFVLQRAEKVVVNNPFLQQHVAEVYNIKKERIHLVYDPAVDILQLPFPPEVLDCTVSGDDKAVLPQLVKQYNAVSTKGKSLAERHYLLQSARVHVVLDTSYQSLQDAYVRLQLGKRVVILTEKAPLLPPDIVTVVKTREELEKTVAAILAGSSEQPTKTKIFVEQELSWQRHVHNILSL